MRILVVTDFGLQTPGGAQQIAYNLTKAISERGHECEFKIYNDEFLTSGSSSHFKRNELLGKLLEIKGIFNPLGCLRFFSACAKFKPDVVWFHNINNEWSWSVLLLGFRNAQKFITFHDLTAISRLKIEPNMYAHISKKFWKRNIAQRIRNSYIRFTLKRVTTVAIGAGVRTILQENRIKIQATIPNTVEPCNHLQLAHPRIKKSVLFAGRENLKGLAQIAKAVALEKEWFLYLAGAPELIEKASYFCPQEKIKYIGQLSNNDLLRLLHSMEYVAVLSQYFDNFPTIALEAIVHGAIPLTTSVTGVSTIVRELGEQYVLEPNEIPNLSRIESALLPDRNVLDRIKNELSNRDSQVEAYLKLFHESYI